MTASILRGLLVTFAISLVMGTATGQDLRGSASRNTTADDDPFLDDDLATVQADTRPYRWFGDLIVRGDRVTGLAGRTLERARARARLGIEIKLAKALDFRVAVEAGQGSDDNADNLRNLDVERSDGGGVDELLLRYSPREDLQLAVGLMPMPLTTTPLNYDQDLRLRGVAGSWRQPVGQRYFVGMTAGYFQPQSLDVEAGRLTAAQLTFGVDAAARWSPSLTLGWWKYRDINGFAQAGLSRRNDVRRDFFEESGDIYFLDSFSYAVDFELAEALAVINRRDDRWPIDIRLHLIRNTAARDARDGARGSLIIGDRRLPGRFEYGLSVQRIGRNAVVAAVNSDEWWFHAGARGYMPWIGYGITKNISVRLAGFDERADGAQGRVRRLLADFEVRF